VACSISIWSVRKKLRASCCVIVLAPLYSRSPKTFDRSAPTIRIGSTPGCS